MFVDVLEGVRRAQFPMRMPPRLKVTRAYWVNTVLATPESGTSLSNIVSREIALEPVHQVDPRATRSMIQTSDSTRRA
jgi:hypothetical protein